MTPPRVLLSAAAAFGLLARGASAARLTRGPYLEDVRGRGAVVCWRTDLPAAGAVALEDGGRARTFQDQDPSARAHCVPVSGLRPSSAYRYRVGIREPWSRKLRWTPSFPFRAAEGPDARSLRFGVLGDAGWGEEEQGAVARRVAADPPGFLLFVGDIVYADGGQADDDTGYFEPYASFLGRVPVYLSLGNHDYYNHHFSYAKGRRWADEHVFAVHRLPEGRSYYSFDRGPAHFAAIDDNAPYPIAAAPSISPGSEQWRWLEKDLCSSKAPWKFVFFHIPVYSSGQHAPVRALERWLAPLFERCGVDVVFQGHDHDYERTFPIVEGRRAARGPVYVTAGIGGAPLRGLYRPRPWTAVFAERYGYVDVALSGRRLKLRAVAIDGKEFDRWETSK